ncbi:dihydrofolate reductase [Sporosarcina sp. PTS2304]|uniref:dihydrofolate reductase n=1 Tax=Sporosarcina sp. PTS2304 TaxID=2283194 RepID=UPI000E0DFE59|nr:dihydrofolate reductase [Sporosarcina sp. PTS2304]AXH99212.1 dihydrofolate reductase [Sporosarcina sp. PTS2304]
MISLLVAHDLDRVIGVNNEMPWHIPEELAYFKKKTMGKAVVMGRKTFESIGRPLPGRLNIIITRNPDYEAEGITVVHDLDTAIEQAREYADEVMVIGGAEIFKLALAEADRLYITVIDKHYPGDTFFPEYGEGWELTSESDVQYAQDQTAYTYQVWDRKK